MKKILSLLALTAFVAACSGGSSNNPPAPANSPDETATTTTPPTETAVTFAAAHTGNFDITGWAGHSLLEVSSVEALEANIAEFEGLTRALHTFRDMGMAEGRTYEYDSANRILRLHSAGRTLEITGSSAVLSVEAAVGGEQGQGQVAKEAPTSMPCALYTEEVKEQPIEQGQTGEKGKEPVVEQGQTGEKPAEQGQVQEEKLPIVETVIVKCSEELVPEKEQGQTQEKPEVRSEMFHVVITLNEVIVVKEEPKQEQVKEEPKQEPVKEEPKQEQVKEEPKQEPVKEEVKEEPKQEQKAEQKGEQKGEQKQEEGKKPTGGQV